MNNKVKFGLWQWLAVISSFALIVLAMDIFVIDSITISVISLKVNKIDLFYGFLWVLLLSSIIFSWSSALNAYANLKNSALHIASGLAMEKIIASGISAYPHCLEETGNMTYAAMPKSGFLKREASIITGVKLDGSPTFGSYDITVWRVLPELTTAYLRAIFIEGRWVVFLPYVAAIAATCVSLATEWAGSPYVLIGKLFT